MSQLLREQPTAPTEQRPADTGVSGEVTSAAARARALLDEVDARAVDAAAQERARAIAMAKDQNSARSKKLEQERRDARDRMSRGFCAC